MMNRLQTLLSLFTYACPYAKGESCDVTNMCMATAFIEDVAASTAAKLGRGATAQLRGAGDTIFDALEFSNNFNGLCSACSADDLCGPDAGDTVGRCKMNLGYLRSLSPSKSKMR